LTSHYIWNFSSIGHHLLKVSDSDITHRKRVYFALTFEIHFIYVFFIYYSIFSTYPNIFGYCFIISHISFMFLFESSILFIFRIDSFATRETIFAVLFCLFSSFYCFLSHIYIFELCCQVGSSWCWFEFCKNRKKVRREVWACEDIKSVWVKHEWREDIVFTTNQFLQVISC